MPRPSREGEEEAQAVGRGWRRLSNPGGLTREGAEPLPGLVFWLRGKSKIFRGHPFQQGGQQLGSHHLLLSKLWRSYRRPWRNCVWLSPSADIPSPKSGTYLPSKQHPPWAKPPLWRVIRGISQDLKCTNPLIQQLQSKKFTLQRDSPCVQRAACQRDWKLCHAHKRGWSDKRWLSHIASK